MWKDLPCAVLLEKREDIIVDEFKNMNWIDIFVVLICFWMFENLNKIHIWTYFTFLNWMPRAPKMSESDIINYVGLDYVVFLRIYNLGYFQDSNIFTYLLPFFFFDV